MPSDKRNSITAKAMSLIFSLFNVALDQEVPFGIPVHTVHSSWTYMYQCPPVSHSSLLTVKSVDLAVPCDGFPENCPYFS